MKCKKRYLLCLITGFLLTFFGLTTKAQAEHDEVTLPWEDPWARFPKPVYDFSSFLRKNLKDSDLCRIDFEPTWVTQSGHRLKMLGAALVYFSPSHGQSIFGHVAERFVYCRDDELVDALFEYTPLSVNRLNSSFEHSHQVDLSTYSESEKAVLASSIYVDFHIDPVRAYAEEQFYKNRTIYEAWFQTDENTIHQMLIANFSRYERQNQNIQQKKKLPQYHALLNNCVLPVLEDLRILDPAFIAQDRFAILTPHSVFNLVKELPVDQFVIYPSQRLFRMLRMKAKGESLIFENFAPFSRASHGTTSQSWVLLYPEGFHPFAGIANLAAATLETAFGIFTLPFSATNKGVPSLKQGLADLLASLGEIVGLRTRYPLATSWTEEETQFFEQLSQGSRLTEYLKTKYPQ